MDRMIKKHTPATEPMTTPQISPVDKDESSFSQQFPPKPFLQKHVSPLKLPPFKQLVRGQALVL